MTSTTGGPDPARSQRGGPLTGTKVVELAGIGPSPFACMLLADLGADVIRIDRPGPSPLPLPMPPEADLLRRGRPSVALDLKHPDGLAAALRLVEGADVLVEGYRPGVAERLGLGPDACLERNPRLVYGRMTGWGQDGPLAQAAGHDNDYIAITGALAAIGSAGGPPQLPLNLVGDFGGGAMYLVVGILAALLEASHSGRGQVVDAAIVDGTSHLATLLVGLVGGGAWSTERGTNALDGGLPWYSVYETSDGGWLAVGALEDQFWTVLLERLGLAHTAPDRRDPSTWPALRALLADTFRTRTRDQWAALLEGTDACVAPVLDFTEAPGHPHLAARRTYVERDGLVQPAPAPRFSRTPGALTTPPPAAGSGTREALTAWGIEDVDALIDSGAAVQA
ncbi:MAG: CaiB/BaiF CoA transferase family protein [Intrasporangium sp.]|uniref:CaiB/BaiF CoA transferase family protein n=1 Tax=Intrasporangium sp. TaxID=1925024 RepID=UPI003F8200E8